MSNISRRPLGSSITTTRPNSETRPYQVWLPPQQYQEVLCAIEKFDGEWSEWASKAMQRLLREDEIELCSLLSGLRRTDKTGKIRLSFRVRNDDFERAKGLAKRYKTSIQAVFSNAFGMQALAPTIIDTSRPHAMDV